MNSKRINTDSTGNKMFVPMNVEGGQWNDEFISFGKMVAIGGIIVGYIAICTYMYNIYSDIVGYIVAIALYTYAISFVVRYYILQERYYFKIYKEMKKYKVTTPNIFWNIVVSKESEGATMLTYADGKIAYIVKLERDTITGKDSSFREVHYDAISDFYRELNLKRLQYVQVSIMEQAGNDPRMMELDKLSKKSDNEQIRKLMNLQIGYIKTITRKSLYESDYFVIYTYDMNRSDTLLDDVGDCLRKVLGGAFIGYTFLTNKDVVEFVREEYGVRYFNPDQAMLDIYNSAGNRIREAFVIRSIEFDDGEVVKIDGEERVSLKNIINSVANGSRDISLIDIKGELLKQYGFEDTNIDLGAGFGEANKKRDSESEIEVNEDLISAWDGDEDAFSDENDVINY